MACRMHSIPAPPSSPTPTSTTDLMGNNPGKDPCMFRIPLRLLAALALVALTGFVAACGSSNEKSGDKASTQGAPVKGKKGGKLEQLGATDVDFLDPGQTYYTAGFQVIYAPQTTPPAPQPPHRHPLPAPAAAAPPN